jgi:chromosome segregation ATPase
MTTDQSPIDALSVGLDAIAGRLGGNSSLDYDSIPEELEHVEADLMGLVGLDELRGGTMSDRIRAALSDLTEAQESVVELEGRVQELESELEAAQTQVAELKEETADLAQELDQS